MLISSIMECIFKCVGHKNIYSVLYTTSVWTFLILMNIYWEKLSKYTFATLIKIVHICTLEQKFILLHLKNWQVPFNYF